MRRSLTTPLGAPAYPPGGPSRFTDREYLSVTHRPTWTRCGPSCPSRW